MKFIVHGTKYVEANDGDIQHFEDQIVIEADTLKTLQEIARNEASERGWQNCWSEEVP